MQVRGLDLRVVVAAAAAAAASSMREGLFWEEPRTGFSGCPLVLLLTSSGLLDKPNLPLIMLHKITFSIYQSSP